jgi:hypothetical protein
MQRSENGRAHGYCHVLSGRSLADYCLLAGRSLAASACRTCHHSGAHDLSPDCLASLRPSERNETEVELVKLK